MNSLLLSDAYKQSHRIQYPKGTNLVYSNWTARSDKHAQTKDGVVVFGIQSLLYNLNKWFDQEFFKKSKYDVIKTFKEEYYEFFGEYPDTKHVEELHDYGKLPVNIYSLPEGTLCPIGVPMLTIHNTEAKFYWVTNFLETLMSTELWLPMTSATIAREYLKILTKWSDKTCDNGDHLPFQAHDFSMRGMTCLYSAASSGAAHLTSFVGSDTIPAVGYLKNYYKAKGLIGTSIPATEHSVMSMGTKEDELGTFKRLITKTYSKGFISIVSDTWDLWKVCTEYIPKLKQEILNRDGKVVIRPDSGNPVDIICGEIGSKYVKIYNREDIPYVLIEQVGNNTPHGERGVDEHTGYFIIDDRYYKATIHDIEWNRYDKQYYYIDLWSDPKVTITEQELKSSDKGVVELMWEIFGGTVNEKGYKILDPHIGVIYGDGITLDRANEICKRLEQQGFASSNIVFGIGSYTYQYNTRDTYGFAMKATYGEVSNKGRNIFKDPITDDGTKKSLKGLIKVYDDSGSLKVKDECTWEEVLSKDNKLELVYDEGKLVTTINLDEIRNNIKNTINE